MDSGRMRAVNFIFLVKFWQVYFFLLCNEMMEIIVQ